MNKTDRPPQEKVCGYEYTVRRGDSFYLIANRLGIPLRDLLEANSDINPARLMVGDVLCIPMEVDDKPPQGLPEQTETEPPVTPEAPPEEAPEEELPSDEDLDTPAIDNGTCPNGSTYTLSEGETAADLQLRGNIVDPLNVASHGHQGHLARSGDGIILCATDKGGDADRHDCLNTA